LKSVSPPKPFQRPTGTNRSKPRASARRASARFCSQVGRNDDSAVLMVQPLLTLLPKMPSLMRWPGSNKGWPLRPPGIAMPGVSSVSM
jgi:hypothetical protein